MQVPVKLLLLFLLASRALMRLFYLQTSLFCLLALPPTTLQQFFVAYFCAPAEIPLSVVVAAAVAIVAVSAAAGIVPTLNGNLS